MKLKLEIFVFILVCCFQQFSVAQGTSHGFGSVGCRSAASQRFSPKKVKSWTDQIYNDVLTGLIYQGSVRIYEEQTEIAIIGIRSPVKNENVVIRLDTLRVIKKLYLKRFGTELKAEDIVIELQKSGVVLSLHEFIKQLILEDFESVAPLTRRELDSRT